MTTLTKAARPFCPEDAAYLAQEQVETGILMTPYPALIQYGVADHEGTVETHRIAAPGVCRFEFTGPAGTHVSDNLVNPTWLEVAVRANTALHMTQETGRTYLDGITLARSEAGVNVYTLKIGG